MDHAMWKNKAADPRWTQMVVALELGMNRNRTFAILVALATLPCGWVLVVEEHSSATESICIAPITALVNVGSHFVQTAIMLW